VLACGPAAAHLCAQTQPPDTTPAALTAALRAAHEANRKVRLRSSAGLELEGRVGELQDGQARVGGTRVDLAQQARLEVRFTHPDPLWDGAALGAVVTMPLGYYVAQGFATGIGDHALTRREAVQAVVGSALFGGLVGLFIDSAREGAPDWRVVWTRAH
jgi:hypothetical protein